MLLIDSPLGRDRARPSNKILKTEIKLNLVLAVAAAGMQVAHASMENLSDYSEFSTAPDYTDPYPAAEDQSYFPRFSWDRVPRYLLMRSDSWMSDESLERITKNYHVAVHEKYNRNTTEYTEDGIALISKRLKEVDPDFCNLFYWNSRVVWGSYRTDSLVKKRGYISNPDSNHKLYNHEVPGMADWWVDTIVDWVAYDENVDGVFCDAIGKYWGGRILDLNGNPRNGYLAKLVRLRNELPDKVLVFNGLHNPNPNGNRHLLGHFDGAYRESSGPNTKCSPPQSQAEAYAALIQMYREAASKGKIVLWRGFATIRGGQQEKEPDRFDVTPEGIARREAYYQKHVGFHLALFLMVAEKYSYFAYAGGDYSGTGENGSGGKQYNAIWDTTYIKEFQRPLGPPLGGPVKEGYVYSRSYKYLDVTVNVETQETTFNWKDPSTITTDPVVSISSPVHGSTASRNEIHIEAFASDRDGSISKVEFFQGSTKLGEDTTEPYSITWENAPGGTYSLTAKATDNEGHVSTSLPIQFIVDAWPTLEPVDAVCMSAKDRIVESDQAGYTVRECSSDKKSGDQVTAFFNFDLSGILSFKPKAGDFAKLSVLRADVEARHSARLLVGQVSEGARNASERKYAWGTASSSPSGPGSQVREKVLIEKLSGQKWMTHSVDISDILDAWINKGERNYGLAIYPSNGENLVEFGQVKITGRWEEKDRGDHPESFDDIADLLMKSYLDGNDSVIELLPALPRERPDGMVKDLEAVGGFLVSIKWDDGKLTAFKVKSLKGTPCTIVCKGSRMSLKLAAGESHAWKR